MNAEELLESRVLITLGEFAAITGQSPEGVRNRADAGVLGMPVVTATVADSCVAAIDLEGKGSRRRRFVRVSDIRRMLAVENGPPAEAS